MFGLLLVYGIFYFGPRLILVRSPLDLTALVVIALILLLSGEPFGETVSRLLVALATAGMCAICLVTLSRSALFDVTLLGSFLYWLMLGISPALEEAPCNPLRTML